MDVEKTANLVSTRRIFGILSALLCANALYIDTSGVKSEVSYTYFSGFIDINVIKS